MIKKIIILLFLISIPMSNTCCSIQVLNDKEFEEKCAPYVSECINILRSKEEENNWKIISDGKKDYYQNIHSKIKFPKVCMYDNHLHQIAERDRVKHKGLNFDVDRAAHNMLPVPNIKCTYQIFGSKDRYQEVGQRLLNAVSDAEKRLKQRAKEIDAENELIKESQKQNLSFFFVPNNAKAMATTAAGTLAGTYLTCGKQKDGKKHNKIKKAACFGFWYFISNFLSNVFTMPEPKLQKTYLMDRQYEEYFKDLYDKREIVCDFYTALTGESKHCSIDSDKISKEKTLSGLPLKKAIEEFGFVLNLPAAPEKVWYKCYDSASEELSKNALGPTVNAQNELYDWHVQDFGEEFVKTGDITKIRYLTKDGIELTQKQLP